MPQGLSCPLPHSFCMVVRNLKYFLHLATSNIPAILKLHRVQYFLDPGLDKDVQHDGMYMADTFFIYSNSLAKVGWTVVENNNNFGLPIDQSTCSAFIMLCSDKKRWAVTWDSVVYIHWTEIWCVIQGLKCRLLTQFGYNKWTRKLKITVTPESCFLLH